MITGVEFSEKLVVEDDGGGVANALASNNFLRCSDFFFFNSLSASISLLFCSRASRFPDLVVAPAGNDSQGNDIGLVDC